MDIYDHGYLTEEEKQQLTVQNAIDLAISNQSGFPLETIIPHTIYRYKLHKDGHISVLCLECNNQEDPQQDVLWDCFINHQKQAPVDLNQYGLREYAITRYRDQSGIFRDYPTFLETTYRVPLAMVHNQYINYRNTNYEEDNILYTLSIISDSAFLRKIGKGGSITNG